MDVETQQMQSEGCLIFSFSRLVIDLMSSPYLATMTREKSELAVVDWETETRHLDELDS